VRGGAGDIDAALIALRRAVEVTDTDDLLWSQYVFNLGSCLIHAVAEGRGSLDEGIEHHRLALDATDPDSPLHPARVAALARGLIARGRAAGRDEDVQEALVLLRGELPRGREERWEVGQLLCARILASLPSTPGHPDLDHVTEEADAIVRRLGVRQLTRLDREEATLANVRAALLDATAVHFACHGRQRPDAPARSGVVLQDGTLTVVDIAQLQLQDAELCFLSACSTATGSPRLPDESIHLAAALQLAGFRHTVATLWYVRDDVAARAADHFYSRLAHDGTAPVATAAAVRQLRGSHPLEPSLWAGLIHIGP
jgi:hypothetical protein